MVIRDWDVAEYLIKNYERSPYVSEASFREEIKTYLFAIRRLTDFFKIFSFTQRLTDTFGILLSHLPLKVFEQLRAMDNLYFLYDDGKVYGCVQEIPMIRWQPSIIMVRISQQAVELSDSELLGLFAHETAHLHLKHYSGSIGTQGEMERAADACCEQWGLDLQIRAIRSRLKTLI